MRQSSKRDNCWKCGWSLDHPYNHQIPKAHDCGDPKCIICPKCDEPLCAYDASQKKAKKLKRLVRPVSNGKPASVGTKEEGETLEKSPLPAVDPFPVEVFPPELARFIREGASAIGCLPDYIAVPMLVLAGAAIGTARCIEPKSSWRELPSLFACIIGDPGSSKSPALKLAAAPVEDRQTKLERAYKKKRAQFQEKKEADRKAKNSKSKKQEKGTNPDSPAMDIDFPLHEPSRERVLTSDATVESLSPVLADNLRGIVVVRDELAAWIRSFNMYRGGRGNDRQFFLSVWSNSTITLDRKGNPQPLIIEKPLLGIVGGLVPDMVRELDDESGGDDGMLDRILFAWPDGTGLAPWSEATICNEAKAAWRTALEFLWDLQPDESSPRAVRIDDKAKAIWIQFHDELGRTVGERDFPHRLKGPVIKLRGYSLRLALILHLLRLACNEAKAKEIDEISMRGSIELVRYFQSHAERVHVHLKKGPPKKAKTEHDQELVLALIQLVESGPWSGTAEELLRTIQGQIGLENAEKNRSLSSADSLGRALRRIQASLLENGVRIDFNRASDKSGNRIVRIEKNVSEVSECQKHQSGPSFFGHSDTSDTSNTSGITPSGSSP